MREKEKAQVIFAGAVAHPADVASCLESAYLTNRSLNVHWVRKSGNDLCRVTFSLRRTTPQKSLGPAKNKLRWGCVHGGCVGGNLYFSFSRSRARTPALSLSLSLFLSLFLPRSLSLSLSLSLSFSLSLYLSIALFR